MKSIYFFFVFLFFLQSMKAWFLWDIQGGYLSLMCLIVAFVAQKIKRTIQFKFDNKFFPLLIIGCLATIIAENEKTFVVCVAKVLLVINVLVIYYLDYKTQKELFHFIINGFIFILIPSIALYYAYLFGYDLFNGGIIHNDNLGYTFTNHYFFLSGHYGIRFQSIFCEPGHLAMIVSLLLFGTGYDYKDWKVWFLTFIILASLSLAGYVIMFLGIIFSRFAKGKINLSKILKSSIGVLTILILIWGGFALLGKTEILNELILSRIVFDEDRGTIAGDNRVSWQVDQYIESMSIEEMLFGGVNLNYNYELQGTGIKMYMIQYGIVSIVLIFLFYALLLKKKFSKIGAFALLLFSLSFIQRCYAIWFCQMVMYALIISINWFNKKSIVNGHINNYSDKKLTPTP